MNELTELEVEDESARDAGSARADNTIELVPRFKDQGYAADLVSRRRQWLEEQTNCRLDHVGACSIPSERMRGNIENPIGASQVPLGVAGPLLINGEHAQGTFYVPLATTEGVLVRSYERGMVTLTRAGGVASRLALNENRICPVFVFEDVVEAQEFTQFIKDNLAVLRAEAEATTCHGKLIDIDCHQIGREVIANFRYFTGDAHGMNMIAKATDQACKWIREHSRARHSYSLSGYSSEKRASGALLSGGKGKQVTAGALIPLNLVRTHLHTTPEQICDMWHRTMIAQLSANVVGYNGQFANGLAATFIACGQDVANVVNSSVGITDFEITDRGDLYASVTLPSLTVATVGGGTALGTARECLEMLGCAGAGQAPKLAEIVAATLLAGELSMGAAIASGEYVAAHETYGRNRPE